MQLALETSTNVCSVAFKNREGKVYEKRTAVRGSHSEQLFLFIQQLREEHGFETEDLKSVIVSEGPGSYTGLRISASAVKGLLFESEVTLYAANTLSSFAISAVEQNPGLSTIHSIIDARRVHVYHQEFSYESGQLSTSGGVKVVPIEQFEKKIERGEAIIGTGLNRMDEEILREVEKYGSDHITARSLLKLYEADPSAQFVKETTPETFEPKYYTSNRA